VPTRIEAEGIDATVSKAFDRFVTFASFREVPSGIPNVERLGEDIVIHEASVHREGAHKKNDVATAVKHR
jgi:hypothetical protein